MAFISGTAYQAPADGFFIGLIVATTPTLSTNWTAKLTGYTDVSNPPTTIRGYAGIGSRQESTGAGRTECNSFCIPVKKDDYFKVVAAGSNYTAAYYWIAFGS